MGVTRSAVPRSEAAGPERLTFAFAEQCDRGKVRDENQDSVRHARTPLGELVIVADGIGGYSGGGTASRMVAEGIADYLSRLPAKYPPELAIREATAQVNAAIFTEANRPEAAHHRMGSTVVLALLIRDESGARALIGHIGDSRAYLMRSGRLNRMTNDHSAVQTLLQRNLITPEEARHHPDASVLTRSLGQKPEVEIEINTFPLLDGDMLLLCSDGLWGYVAERDIQMVVGDPGITVENGAKTLLNLALAAGGPDNIGIELVRVSTPKTAAEIRHRYKPGALETVAAVLLAVAVLGTLGYIAVQRHWLSSILPGQHATMQAGNVGPLSVAVVGASRAEAGRITTESNWERLEVPADKQTSCRNLALGARHPVVYYEQSNNAIGRLIRHNPELFQSGNGYDMRKMDADAKKRCGAFNAIVILPESE